MSKANIREIKFRVWNKITNHFSYFTNKHRISDINSSELMIFMQYTGLKDRNNTEVYEGDIVKFIPSSEYGKVTTYGKSQNLGIEWENSKTAFFTPMFYLGCESELEVIGNIYENPELLKENI